MKLEKVKGPLVEAWGMIRTDFRSIFTTMLKIGLVGVSVIIAALILASAAAIALWNFSSLGAIGIAVLIGLAGIFIGSVVLSVSYNFIDAKSRKINMNFSETARSNLIPMLAYEIVSILIFAIIFAPFMVMFFFLYTSGGIYSQLSSIIFQLLVRIGLALVSAIVSLFIQFAIFEVLISKAGVLEGFARSIRMVRRNFIETIAFSIIIWAAESAISIPFTIVAIVLVFIGLLGTTASIWILVILLLLAFILLFVLAALANTVGITAKYKYWIRIRK